MSQAEWTVVGSNASDASGQNVGSLVCEACWNTPFAFASFQTAWCASEGFSNGFSYKPTWKDLTHSADAGCNWCTLLVAWIPTCFPSAAGKDRPDPQDTFKVTICFVQEAPGNLPGRNALDISINGTYTRRYEVHAAADDNAARFITARDLIWQVSSQESIEHASNLLRECTSEHAVCSKLLTPHPALPTRVIDCSEPARPKLYTPSPCQSGIYAALSYVWGGDQPNATREDNIDAYTQGIDSKMLPQTIRDAIVLTQRLGIPYLWVDSLCILMHSIEDKGREIAAVRKTYQNAHVTIIAASAQKAAQGFLQDRPAPVRLPFKCPDRQDGIMLLRSASSEERLEPVDTRALGLHEWLLSSRALVFTSRTLQYHCYTRSINVGNANEAICAKKLRLPSILLQSVLPTLPSTEESLEIERAWRMAITEFTKRKVTDPRDKLLCMYGVVDLFSRVWSHSKYLAGLWQHNLLEGLLWRSGAPQSSHRPATYRAPSWSWAAIDGEIVPAVPTPHPGEDKPECKILQSTVTLLKERMPFGEVTSGILQLNAVLKRVLWNPDEGRIYTLTADSEVSVVSSQNTPLGDAYHDCAEDASNAPGQVWAIPLRSSSVLGTAEGLIVDLVSGQDGPFRRVGLFQIPTKEPLGDSNIPAWLATPRQEINIV